MTSPDHTVHQDLLGSPPVNTKFDVVLPRIKEGESSKFDPATRATSAFKRRLTQHPWAVQAHQIRKMHSYRRAVEDSRFSPDIVHACGHLYSSGAPWVGDFEHAGALWMYEPRAKRGRLLEFVRTMLADEHCIGIRVWSKSAAHSFETVFPELSPKLRVIYPAVPHQQVDALLRDSSRHRERARILFVGRSFLWKGGREVLASFKQMKASGIPFEADFISNIPPGYRAMRQGLEDVVSFYPCTFPRSELFSRFFPRADVFVLPTLGDTFGYALVEALTFGLPVVAAANGSAAPEIIRHGTTGFLAEPQVRLFDDENQFRVNAATFEGELESLRQEQLITDLVGHLARLVTEPRLRKEMSHAALDETRRGRFTTDRRNANMAELYGLTTSS